MTKKKEEWKETMKILCCETKKVEFRRKNKKSSSIKRLYIENIKHQQWFIVKKMSIVKKHYNIVCNYL